MSSSTFAVHSPNFPWNPRLAHLRCMAALLVLAFHAFHRFFGLWKPQPQAWPMGWLAEGHTGVSLFFVLSGFLFMRIALHGQAAHEPAQSAGQQPWRLDYWRFVQNRGLRIAPLFLVVFFVAISVGRDKFAAQDVLYVLFSNLGQAPTSNWFMTGAAWTISVEFTFYLVFPFLARFAMAQGPGYLLRLVGLLLLFKLGGFLASERPTHMLYSTLLGRMDQFLIGMLAALWSVQGWFAASSLKERATSGLAGVHGGWVLAALVLMWALLGAQAHWASYFLPQPRQWAWVLWPTVEAAGWAAVIVAYAHWRGSLASLLGRAGIWLERMLEKGGEISFSLYLWHGLVIFLLDELWHRWTVWLGWAPVWPGPWQLQALGMGALVLVLSWGVATWSYRTIEAPFLQLRRRYV